MNPSFDLTAVDLVKWSVSPREFTPPRSISAHIVRVCFNYRPSGRTLSSCAGRNGNTHSDEWTGNIRGAQVSYNQQVALWVMYHTSCPTSSARCGVSAEYTCAQVINQMQSCGMLPKVDWPKLELRLQSWDRMPDIDQTKQYLPYQIIKLFWTLFFT